MTPQNIAKILEDLFPNPAIPLNHQDPYTLLIAVLLSQRSTDATVNKVTPYLFKKANTPEKMLLLSVEELQSSIRPCGLSLQKAKNILALSKLLLEQHGGLVPKSLDALEALPGVGHKTASCTLTQAFDIPAFPVDTHIFRCAKRWQLSSPKATVQQVEKDLKRLFPEKMWHKIHLQMIYFARKYCPARGHDQKNCPICKHLNSVP